jgi:hypothetical protein
MTALLPTLVRQYFETFAVDEKFYVREINLPQVMA